MVSYIPLVWGERAGTTRRGGLCGKIVDLDWDEFPNPARFKFGVVHDLNLVRRNVCQLRCAHKCGTRILTLVPSRSEPQFARSQTMFVAPQNMLGVQY